MSQARPRRAKADATATSSVQEAAEPSVELVPSRRQYLDLKSEHPHALLLYRLGDFYETFDDDAKVAARDARITLTSRSFGRSGRVPMAGIPHHALNHYLGRLLAAGHTIAIAEQVSEPGKGLVERRITRVLTPGTVAEPALLPSGENRYLAALHRLGERLGLSWVDVSTGEFAVTELSGSDATTRIAEELARLNPAECLVSDRPDDDDPFPPFPIPGHRTRVERWHFEPDRALTTLCLHFGARSLAPYGCADLPAAIGAAGAILAYLGRTDPALTRLLTGLRTESPGRNVGLDSATRRNLELTRSLKTHGSRGSLLGILDQTHTSMGARTLRRLLIQPLRDLAELRRRQGVIAALVEASLDRATIAAKLSATGDLERLVGRVAQGQATIRDFLALGAALTNLPGLIDDLQAIRSPDLDSFAASLDPCQDTLAAIEAAVVDHPDGSPAIREGFWPELDAALAGASETRAWLAGLERSERDRTGIKSLKVGFNKVFGYYIEVTRPNLSLVPAEYMRKQTIATGERYVTVPLKEAEARILAADEQISAHESAALAHLASLVCTATARLTQTAGLLAHLDAFLALAEVAARNAWVRPALDETETIEITAGRHPVVEASLAGLVGIGNDSFIPNDCHIGGNNPRVLVVTGPNMGGKSTYLRQTAVITLLAQIGSLVPAASARIGLVDRIFTRVGAQDDLAGGSSTFMVEMVETATILHQATSRSLLVLDEVGRGTSTDDGLAIARAVLEDLHDRVGARTLFATHYLELTALAGHLSAVANVHVSALEQDGRVIFLYAVRPGPADRAYGVQVARLAGLPPWVADRAESVLAALPNPSPLELATTRLPDSNEFPPTRRPADPPTRVSAVRVAEDPDATYQLALDGFPIDVDAAERLARELRDLDLANLTPRQALDWLFSQQSRLGLP